MDCFEPYELIWPFQIVQGVEPYEVISPFQIVQGDKTYTCEEVKWYNFKEGERYLMFNEGNYRIGTFSKFKWIEMYKQWMSVFTYVRASDNEYCQEVSISGALPYVYYKLM
jgi:hypothetical protein